MIQEFTQALEDTMQRYTDGVHTALPGVIASFDPGKGTATVELKGQFKKPDGQTLNYPAAANVPVVFPQSAGQQATIAFPVRAGDGCLVVFAEQSLEAWKAGGTSNLDLKHDLSNAMAIPGMFRTPNQVMQDAVAQDAIIIANQNARISIRRNQIELSADQVEVRTPKVHMTGDVVIDGELTVRGIAFTPHQHGAVSPGSGQSGPPDRG